MDLARLRQLVDSALKLAPGNANKQEVEEPSGLLGKSLAMDKLRGQIKKLARSQAPVYISGESGSGKEMVARMIHQLGSRCDKPFVPVNCRAIPSELMESEFSDIKGQLYGGH